jgi:hypothetical protein
MPDDSPPQDPSEDLIIGTLRAELEKAEPSKRNRIIEKVFIAALSVIPWIGGVLVTAETFRTDEGNVKLNKIQTQWLEEHQKKILLLMQALNGIGKRLASLGDEIDERIESEEYLALVRKTFRAWDESDTEEKRRLLANVLTNAAGTRICSDDVIRIFIDWIRMYSEVHFAIMRQVYKEPESTRYDIWVSLYGEDTPREDSSQTDLYRYLIRELNTGGVIRQPRQTNAAGAFLRKRPRRVRPGGASSTMKSSFDDQEPYVLTELGKEFVHYTMNEVVARIEGQSFHTPGAEQP